MNVSVPYVAGSPIGDDGRADVEPDHHWVVRTCLVAIAFAGVMLWRSAVIDIPLRDPAGGILRSRVLVTAVTFLVLAVLDALRRSPRGRRRPRAVLATLRHRWPARRLALAAVGLAAYHVVYFSYRNLKSWDVLNAPRDHLLTRIDQALFFGHSPAVLLHSLLGEHWAALVLVAVYEFFPKVASVSFVAATVFGDRLRDGYVFLSSLMWVWILGVTTYYLVPSLGPFSDRPQDFAGLPSTVVTSTQAEYLSQRLHLLADPRASDSFAQVSAFASLHVGVTTVIVLMLAYYRLRRLRIVGSVFLAFTIVATIYLGWHFVVDDIAGLAIGAAAVALGHFTVYPTGRPDRTADRDAVRLSAGTPDHDVSVGGQDDHRGV